MIFHLVSKKEWEALLPKRPYTPSTYLKDGFIHCSGDEVTVLGVANRFYKDVPGDVLLLVIDETKLTSTLKWEAPSHPNSDAVAKPMPSLILPPEVIAEIGPEAEAFAQPVPQPQTEPQFPHIYGPLNREAIVDIRVFTRGADGAYTGTQALSTPTSTVQSTLAQSDLQNPLNLKTPSQMAQELLDATDGFSDALKRYKDQVESRIERADKDIKGSLGE